MIQECGHKQKETDIDLENKNMVSHQSYVGTKLFFITAITLFA